MTLGIHIAERGIIEAVLLLNANIAITMETGHALATIVGGISVVEE